MIDFDPRKRLRDKRIRLLLLSAFLFIGAVASLLCSLLLVTRSSRVLYSILGCVLGGLFLASSILALYEGAFRISSLLSAYRRLLLLEKEEGTAVVVSVTKKSVPSFGLSYEVDLSNKRRILPLCFGYSISLGDEVSYVSYGGVIVSVSKATTQTPPKNLRGIPFGLLGAGVLCFGCLYGIDLKLRPKETEKVDLLLCAYGYDSKSGSLPGKLLEGLSSSILEVNVTFADLSRSVKEVNDVIISVMDEVDVYVLPASLAEEKLPHLRAEIDPASIETYLGGASLGGFYSHEGKDYGVMVYDSSLKKGALTSYVTYETDSSHEDYYAFFRIDSPQGEGVGAGPMDGSLSLLKRMLRL